MTCSIVVPVRGRAELTERCLDVLLAAGHSSVELEVIVVDDGSRDRTPQVLDALGDRIRVVRHASSQGFARACNDGAAASTARHLVFLNNDTIPQPGWLDELVSYADAHPKAVAVGAKLLYPDDTVQHAGVVIDQYGYPKHVYGGFPAWHPATCRSRSFQAVTAACMLVRRDAFERLRGFDPSFRNGYEDVDFCLRAAAWGEVHYCADSVLYHLESMTEGRFDESSANERLWQERWAARVAPDDFRYYAADGLIGITYSDPYPIRIDLSPMLGVVEGEDFERRTDHLLGVRARRSFAMTKELARLAGRPQQHAQRVADGTARWLSPAPSRRLVSVVVQAPDDAHVARRVVEAVFAQQADEIVEVLALDALGDAGVQAVLTELDVTVIRIDDPACTVDALSHVHGEVVVVLAPEAVPADRNWLAPLLARVGEGTVACSDSGVHALAALATDVRARKPDRLDPLALADWASSWELVVEPRSRIVRRDLSPLEHFARGAACRGEGERPQEVVARLQDELGLSREQLNACVRELVESVGRAAAPRHEDRPWIEDAVSGRLAAGVWGAGG